MDGRKSACYPEETMGVDLSFVICTRNGASKLRPTLEHLAAQRFRNGISREVLLVDNGFAPWLKGREGGSLGAGEDTELCLALLLAGWRAHYDPRLSSAHGMPADRLEWRFACKLAYQGRAPNPALAAYRRVLAERLGRGDAAGHPPTWKAGLAHEIVRAAYHVPRGIVWWMRGASFCLASLSVVSSLGGVVATWRFGQRYDALLAELRGARWIGDGPARVARAGAGARSTAAGRGTGATL